MKSVIEFAAAKTEGRKISMVTCYDACFARLLETTRQCQQHSLTGTSGA
jgi:ketopantoate hydroxymethyltransferase